MTGVGSAEAIAPKPQPTVWLWSGWLSAALLWLLLTIAMPVAAATADIVRVNGFPLGFFLVAQMAPIGLVAIGLWLSLWDRGVSGVAGGECDRLEGLALAMLVMSPALVLFALMRLETDGFDGLMLGHGIVAGLVLWLLLTAIPRRRSTGHVGLAGVASGARDTTMPTPVGTAFLLAAALVPLAATHLYGAGRLVDELVPSGFEGLETMSLVALFALAAAVFLPARVVVILIGGGFLALLACVIVIAAVLLPVATPETSVGLPGVTMPQVAYGPAVAEVSRLERDLTVAGLADPVTTRQFARPWTSYSMANGLLYALAAALATVAMMAAIAITARVPRADLSAPSNPPRRARQVRGIQWLLVLVLLAVLTVPAVSVALKAYRYGAVEDGISRTAPPVWLATALRNGWAQMCDPPPPTIKRGAGEGGNELSAAGPADVQNPDWWLEDPSAVAVDSLAPRSPAEVAPTQADDVLVSRYLVANNLCRGPVPRLAAGDITVSPLALTVLATAMTGTHPGAWHAVEAIVLASLVLGLVGLLTLLRTMVAPGAWSWWMPVGVVLPMLLCVLALGLVRALPLLWVDPFELPVWTLTLMAGGVAPALAIRSAVREPDSLLLTAVPVLTGVIGIGLALAYLVLTSEMTVFMSTLMPQFSDAPSWKIDDLESLLAACLYGSHDACTAARELSRETANIAGLRPEAIGVLIGAATLFFGWLMLQNARQFRRRSRA